MRINVHAGHNPDGKAASGTIGLVKESTVTRNIKDAVIRKLRAMGHTVYDCTVEDGNSQEDVLQKIVEKCNAHNVDTDVSIHLNSGAEDSRGDGKTTGTEVYIYNEASKIKGQAEAVARAISALGFRLRTESTGGVKTAGSLYVLRHTKAPAMLIECFFCDDADDVALYRRQGAERLADAIVQGITGSRTTDVSAEKGDGTASEETVVMANITGNSVNIRKGPGTQYPAIGQVNKGQQVRIWKEEDGWSMIDNGKWVFSGYVRKDSF